MIISFSFGCSSRRTRICWLIVIVLLLQSYVYASSEKVMRQLSVNSVDFSWNFWYNNSEIRNFHSKRTQFKSLMRFTTGCWTFNCSIFPSCRRRGILREATMVDFVWLMLWPFFGIVLCAAHRFDLGARYPQVRVSARLHTCRI